MIVYGVREVATTLRLSSRKVYRLVRSGFVTPTRGPRRRLQFSFQDILLLKTASGLMAAAIPQRQVSRAIAALRRKLPAQLPVAGLRIRALGDRVVVQSILGQSWDAESGQGLFTFDITPTRGSIRVIESVVPGVAESHLDSWFDAALSLEDSDVLAAREAYQRIIAADEHHVEAYINCGRLFHEARDWKSAERLYRKGIAACEACAMLFFNLGVLLEDLDRSDEAIAAYQQALQCDPDHRDSHHNLARLFEAIGRTQHAIRHFNHYRRLNKDS
jgi:tetratricopeptide (TPR) repeat protein